MSGLQERSAKARTVNRGCRLQGSGSVANLRQDQTQIVSAVESELLQFAMQGGAGNIEVSRSSGDLAARASKSPLKYRTLGGDHVIDLGARLADQVRRRQRTRECFGSKPESPARRTSCADHKIVAIDSKH